MDNSLRDFLSHSFAALSQLRQTNRLMKLHFLHKDGPDALLLIDKMETEEVTTAVISKVHYLQGIFMNFAPQVKDATEAIQQVSPLVDAITNLLQTPAGWLVLAMFFLWLLFNKDFSHIFEMFERKKKRRLEHLDVYISKPECADEESVKVFRDLRDAHYFKVATGIYAEKRLRRALTNLHDRTSHLISWTQIRRAFPYIEANEDGTIAIRKLSKFETAGYIYNELVGYISFLFAVGLLSLFFFSHDRTFTSFILGVFCPFAAVLFAMFVFAQNWPVHAAKRIQKELATTTSRNEKRA